MKKNQAKKKGNPVVGFRPTREGIELFETWYAEHKKKCPWVTKNLVLCEAFSQIISGRINFPWQPKN